MPISKEQKEKYDKEFNSQIELETRQVSGQISILQGEIDIRTKKVNELKERLEFIKYKKDRAIL